MEAHPDTVRAADRKCSLISAAAAEAAVEAKEVTAKAQLNAGSTQATHGPLELLTKLHANLSEEGPDAGR